MNWDEVKGNWKIFTGRAKEQWGRLTDDDLTQIGGHWDQFVGKIQEAYGVTKEEAVEQVSQWMENLTSHNNTERGSRAYGTHWTHDMESELRRGVNSLEQCVHAKPLSTLATALGTGIVLGMFLARR